MNPKHADIYICLSEMTRAMYLYTETPIGAEPPPAGVAWTLHDAMRILGNYPGVTGIRGDTLVLRIEWLEWLEKKAKARKKYPEPRVEDYEVK